MEMYVEMKRNLSEPFLAFQQFDRSVFTKDTLAIIKETLRRRFESQAISLGTGMSAVLIVIHAYKLI